MIFALAVIGVLLAVVYYQVSWIPEYSEAEAYFPVVAEFGLALSQRTPNGNVTMDDLKVLLGEDRFRPLLDCGFMLAPDKNELIIVRVNKVFSFRIRADGYPVWEKN